VPKPRQNHTEVVKTSFKPFLCQNRDRIIQKLSKPMSCLYM